MYHIDNHGNANGRADGLVPIGREIIVATRKQGEPKRCKVAIDDQIDDTRINHQGNRRSLHNG